LCLKLATTLDGKIADREGTSKWITGPEARQRVHELRNIYDCVLVGCNTAVRDDPALNVRDVPGGRDPLRAVVDARLSVSPTSRLCTEGTGGDTVLFCSREASGTRAASFPPNVKLVEIGHEPGSRLLDVEQTLRWLAEQGTLTVLCEGGGRLAGRLLERGLVDEICWFVAPKIIGDPQAVPAVATVHPVVLEKCWSLVVRSLERVGADILLEGVPSSAPIAVDPANRD
jgi:diaminohydroxyphosphoribosylaminopyrimidine deaminase/5-amino-6-(5-phosphoribosylamino)uracil reductase